MRHCPTLTIRVLSLAAALLAATAAALADGPAGRATVGWRGNGTGVFPQDCTVVAEWSETQNIVWKTPLPNAGNGSPIVVGRKAFVMCEPGFKSDCPLLVCISADDGKLLWQREVDHFDLLEGDQAKQARQHRAMWFELYRKGMRYTVQLEGASEEKQEQIRARMAEEGIGKYGFGQINLTSKHPWVKNFKAANNWVDPTWGFLVIGTTFPTPVSDGECVYVVTCFNTVACYDLEGRRKWIRWFRDDKLGYHDTALFVHSPLLVDGKLIVEGNRRIRALEPATGQTLWDVPTTMQLYMVSTAVALNIGGSAASSPASGTRAVATCSGEVIRLSDGKVLATKIGLFANGAGFVGDGKDTIFGLNGRSGGHYNCGPDRLFAPELFKKLIAVKLELTSPDEATPRLLWSMDYAGEDVPVYHKGMIYKGGGIVDAAAGKYVKQSRQKDRGTDQGWILVDGKLIGLRHTGAISVVDAETLKPLAANQLDMVPPDPSPEKVQQMTGLAKSLKPEAWYVWNFGRSLPFASGNRLFIRSFDSLYCIGEPGTKFAPSQAFLEQP